MMASKRSGDQLATEEPPQSKKAAHGRISDPGPISTETPSSNYVHSRTASSLRIVKLTMTQPAKHLPFNNTVCSRPATPQAVDLDSGNSTAMTASHGVPLSPHAKSRPVEHPHAYLYTEATRQLKRPPTARSGATPHASESSSIARTQLADIGNTITSLERQLHEARQQIAREQRKAQREEQLAKDKAKTVSSLEAELADALRQVDEGKRARMRLEEANANLKARCNEFSNEHSEKLLLQEQVKEDRAIYDQCQHEKRMLEEKVKQATKQLAEHLEKTRLDNAVSELLKLVTPSDLGHIADTMAKLQSLLEQDG